MKEYASKGNAAFSTWKRSLFQIIYTLKSWFIDADTYILRMCVHLMLIV